MSSEALSPAQHAPLLALARSCGWRLVVLFGSLAREGEGRDVDLAVLPAAAVELMEQGRWQARLEALSLPAVPRLGARGDG